MLIRTLITPLAVLGMLALVASSQTQPGLRAKPGPSNSGPAGTAAARENYDPLLDLPPLPRGDVTLIGGTIASLDEVMNRMVVQPFGGKQKMKIAFDSRTHFYRDGQPASQRDIKQGQRIYLDTMLNGSTVFAKTIWIRSSVESGLSRGQIVSYDAGRKILTVRDELSRQPVKMQLTPATVLRKNNQPASPSDLVENALVALAFGPQREVREVTLLAAPGTSFTFQGRLSYLDLSKKLIAVDNHTDHNKYDISIEAVSPSILRQLREGQEVNVTAVFDGSGYAARRIDLLGTNSTQPQ